VKVSGRTISKYNVALLVIILIGLFLRVYDLGTQSIWYDESSSVWIAKMSFLSQVVQATRSFELAPPLYFIILHYWIALFGTSEVALRSLSALFGVLAIPVIYVLGRRLFNDEVGLLAALILALSSFNIWYSQEARMYSLMVLLALLSMYFFLRFVRRSTLASSAGYVLCTTLLLYTHYYGIFVVVAQNVYLLTLLFFSREHAFRLKHWITLQVLLVAFFAPWISVLMSQASGAHLWPSPTTDTMLSTLYTYSAMTISPSAATTMLVWLFFALVMVSLFTYRKVRGSMDWKAPVKALKSYAWEVRLRKDYNALYFLAVWLLAFTVISFVIAGFFKLTYEIRYTIAGSIALYLLVAKGINNVNDRLTKLAVVGVVIVLSMAILPGYYSGITRPPAREVISFIDANAQSNDVILIWPSVHNITFNYYNNRTDVTVKQISADNSPDKLDMNSESFAEEVGPFVTGHDRVWLYCVHDGTTEAPTSFMLGNLNETYVKIYMKSYFSHDPLQTYTIYLYEERT
jgi:uncharacterized membrane protein